MCCRVGVITGAAVPSPSVPSPAAAAAVLAFRGGHRRLTASRAALALYDAPEGDRRSAPAEMCSSYTSRSLWLVRSHSSVMPS